MSATTSRTRPRLAGAVVPVAGLGSGDRAAMFRLMLTAYHHLSRTSFEDDLDEKDEVALVWDDTGSIRAFSTILVAPVTVAGDTVRMYFSGDTIVDHRVRTANPLLPLVLRHALITAEEPGGPLHWFLITKGHRTYRILPLLFHRFHPRPDEATPPAVAATLEAFALARYPRRYDPGAGVIRAGQGEYRLRPEESAITESRLADPYVRFFVDRNPAHAVGDELCCVAPLAADNLTPAGRRLAGLDPDRIVRPEAPNRPADPAAGVRPEAPDHPAGPGCAPGSTSPAGADLRSRPLPGRLLAPPASGQAATGDR